MAPFRRWKEHDSCGDESSFKVPSSRWGKNT